MTSVSSLISLLSFCLVDLSIVERRVLKSPTISVWGFMCAFSVFFNWALSAMNFPLSTAFIVSHILGMMCLYFIEFKEDFNFFLHFFLDPGVVQ